MSGLNIKPGALAASYPAWIGGSSSHMTSSRTSMRNQTSTRNQSGIPSHAATYERARRLANLAVWTVALQKRRLKTDEPEDADFLFRRWADFQFLIVALTRLRRAASLAAKVPTLAAPLQAALVTFDTSLPMLKRMRDIAEHIDDYALDRGRDRAITRASLEVGVIGDSTFEWLGQRLDSNIALSAAHQLFKEIQQAQSLLVSERGENERPTT